MAAWPQIALREVRTDGRPIQDCEPFDEEQTEGGAQEFHCDVGGQAVGLAIR
jgi:hypothetical protein